MKKRIAILASGSGSNFQAIVDASSRYSSYEVALCISDKSDAFVLKRAEKAGVTAFSIVPKLFENKNAYEQEIVRRLEENHIDFIVLAGYMRLIGSVLLEKYENRIVNIHPSLLPSFPGLHAVKQALDAKVKITGMTIHFVDAGMDTGPIIMQDSILIDDNDTEQTLTEKIHKLEHEWYPKVISSLCLGKIDVSGREVIIN